MIRTEQDWLASKSLDDMFAFLRRRKPKPSRRKYRLYACACARRALHLVDDEVFARAIGVAERHADKLATAEDLTAVSREGSPAILRFKLARDLQSEAAGGTALMAAFPDAEQAARSAAIGAATSALSSHQLLALDARTIHASPELGVLTALMREIFGNPFRTTAVDQAWLAWNDRMIDKHAQRIYAEGKLSGQLEASRLRLLGDALEKAGCANAEVLEHCRAAGLHVPGCWVVDLLLGLE